MTKSAQESPSGSVRIVDVSSDGNEKLAPNGEIVFDDINTKDRSVRKRHCQSKLANVLHAKELGRRYREQQVIALSLHPGTVKT